MATQLTAAGLELLQPDDTKLLQAGIELLQDDNTRLYMAGLEIADEMPFAAIRSTYYQTQP